MHDRESRRGYWHGLSCTTLALSMAAILAIGSPGASHADVIFDNTPAPLPANIPSVGYQANHVAEFGNAITFAGTARSMTDVTIIMSSWAKESDWTGFGDGSGYDHEITLTFYNPGSGTSVGSLIATLTQDVHVPWYTGPGIGGTAFPVTYDFTGVTVPDTVIFGVAFNTETYGANPIGVPGPYVSLNYGVASVPPSVGTYINANDAYIAADGGSFSQDIGGWSPYGAAIQVNAVPEPSCMILAAAGSVALVVSRLRQRRRS